MFIWVFACMYVHVFINMHTTETTVCIPQVFMVDISAGVTQWRFLNLLCALYNRLACVYIRSFRALVR